MIALNSLYCQITASHKCLVIARKKILPLFVGNMLGNKKCNVSFYVKVRVACMKGAMFLFT